MNLEQILVYFSTIFSIGFIIVGKIKFKSIFNPISLFNIVWISSLNISVRSFFGIYRPSLEVFIMSLLMLLSYNFFCILIKLKKIKKGRKKKFSSKNIRFKLLYFLNFAGIIWLYPASKKSLVILKISGITAVRTAMGSGILGINSVLDWITVSWIIYPIFNAILVLGIYTYIFNNEKKLLIISIVNVLLYTITFGGRWIILRSILLFLFISFLYMDYLKSGINNGKIKRYGKKIKKNYIIILLLVFVILFITKYRSFDNNILKTIVAYSTGSLSSLSYFIETTKERIYLLGTGFFSGILDFPLIILKIIFGIDFIRPTEYIGQFTSSNVYIGGGIIFNGFTSCLLDFWLDFGILGALINGSLLGIIMMKLYNRSMIFFRWRMIYIFILSILVVTPIKWEFDLQWSWMTIIFLILFVKEKKTD